MLKFYHVGDVHLGAAPDAGQPWSEERGKEIWESFRSLLERADGEGVDLLLLSGDLFHRQPLKRELRELNYLFASMKRTQVVFIAGNHDYLKQDSCYREFQWNENVHFLSEPTCQRYVFPKLGVSVYGFSYHQRELEEPLCDGLQPKKDGNFSILLAHGGDARHIPMDFKKLEASGFDYIALGHIHKPRVIAKNIAYGGALEPIDRDDTGPHGFLSGHYDGRRLEIALVPWAKREYIPLKLTVEPETTDYQVRAWVRDQIIRLGDQNLYRICLRGFRNPDTVFCTEAYKALGCVVEAEDQTKPYYDLERLKLQHGDDLVGRYIRRFQESPMGETEKKALYWGLAALLEGGE